MLEHKPAAVVLHTRRMADESAARAAEEAALEVTTRHTGLHVLHGKHVVEVSVVRADKGTALVALRDEVGADAVAYFGDDVTDEDAFRALGPDDVTVKVGPGETAARFRVESPEDAAGALRCCRATLASRRSVCVAPVLPRLYASTVSWIDMHRPVETCVSSQQARLPAPQRVGAAPVEARTTSSGRKTYSARGDGSPAISSSRARTAASAIAWTLWRTVVSGGSVKAMSGESS